ncbi:2-isopropylmalate synthase [Aestuariirhabdus litorea]|uniref:2-isopropylmalate synthase n=1 Tax=Aestuariirhabdus litorea TaxID=2528527 RepID=A0A3P3VQ66_9GAMM|nr:2-isopropylmalate synthase [Aestuariirhabdus litorea]RRJ83806.1 2-isopropylmalate synthase [Aestuariirhabdus litorea]RWW97029.1 2-isopropylmalate synthase [Endozoicomonadaceae bacterium GTF-13]
MTAFDHRKYQPFPPVKLTDRQWPDRVIDRAPRWCSVDLRDGNQALMEPMSVEQKKRLFLLLVDIGFKEIEVGFPAASQPDFDFLRLLVDERLIPDDVTVQVLTQAREPLIKRTFESLVGVKSAIVHLYNSTSRVQREQVFGLDTDGIKQIAVKGAKLLSEYAARYPDTHWTFQYSPESFTGTELEYAVEVVDAVTEVWQPTAQRPAIINLPATVEMSTPNVYADQIEWFCRRVARREALLISVHTHNDRGCGVAAAELAVMAGADRVEGTLMGNGERTGNMDIVTMAMNLYSQGVDPCLQLGDMDRITRTYKECTQLPIHPRHPYVGELVFTAFSGSHQDAINKCLSSYNPGDYWQVAYLPIDPADLGRSYQEVIRINSQSGKGGVAYVLDREYGLQLPRWMQIDFSQAVQRQAEQEATELSPTAIWKLFKQTYVSCKLPYHLEGYQVTRRDKQDSLVAEVSIGGEPVSISAAGGGVVDAFVQALQAQSDHRIGVVEYSEHAIGQGEDAKAIAYVLLSVNGERVCGVGISEDIVNASLSAILSALNRSPAAAQPRAA